MDLGTDWDQSAAPELQRLATDALQAQERLQLRLRQDKESLTDVYQDAHQITDQLRSLCSKLDGSHANFGRIDITDAFLQNLRYHMLQHVPGSMSPEIKQKLKDMVTAAFASQCKKVIFAGLVSCPWYVSTQDDRGLQAKHNTILVVYVNGSNRVLSPINPHIKEKNSEVIDKDWFYAAEVYHFVHYLVRGKVRFVEALYLPDSVIFCQEPEWSALLQSVQGSHLLPLQRGFLQQCCGQAMGAIAKKSKSSGNMRLKDTATFCQFCEGFRLLHHAECVMSGGRIEMGPLTDVTLSERAQTAAQALVTTHRLMLQSEENNRPVLFEMLLAWHQDLSKVMNKFKDFSKHAEVTERVENWLLSIRTADCAPKPLAMHSEDAGRLRVLMDKIGGPVKDMDPSNIVMVAQAGSCLYGLSTPQSDVDYVVIYADDIQRVLSSSTRPDECFESRGPEKSFEYGCYEVRLLCEMLLKSSVVILELVFSDDLEYMSDAWKALHQHQDLFVTEHAVLQYFGLIKNNMINIEHKKYIGTRRETKLFYQIFHKLHCLEAFLQRRVPAVRVEGEVRDFIMRIRHGPLQGDIARDVLYKLARDKIASMHQRLTERTTRLPELTNYQFLCHWLRAVRGYENGS